MQGIVPHVPVTRAVNNQEDGTLFDCRRFHYDEKINTYRCPANQTLGRKNLSRNDRMVVYAASPQICGACALKARCTKTPYRRVTRHLHEAALERMHQRARPEMMRLRKLTVEHPFASCDRRQLNFPAVLPHSEMLPAIFAQNVTQRFSLNLRSLRWLSRKEAR